ncbi:MAG: hypothetical protein J1F41_00190 [Lachnospiraceae bacterium]|nr:hypothetical protein [Lachnospiraceae bacterium]
MEIGNIKPTNNYADRNRMVDQSQNTGKKSILFTNATDIGKALATGQVKVDGVTIDLSKEAMQALSDAREKFYADRDAETLRYVAEFNSYAAKAQSEAMEDISEDMAKALETARRIARGDVVPAIDERKLLEYDKELYQMAKASAMLHAKEKHKKEKSLYEDEEKREYTDPEAETAPMQKYGVEVEVSLGDVPAVENITEGPLESF